MIITATLNGCQTKALPGLVNWFHGNEQCAVLHGQAGSGKTFLIKYLLKKLKETNAIQKALLIAETNEAVGVLAKATNYEHSYNTVCSALCLAVSFDKQKKILKQYAEPDFSDFQLIIVDEASQNDLAKLKLLFATNKKILFVGHKSQLPPVDINQSLTDKCISPVFEMNFPTFNLETIERHSGELLEFCKLSEKLLYESGTLPDKFFLPRVEFFRNFEEKQFLENIFSLKTTILCYTNATVAENTEYFRTKFFGKKAIEQDFLVGDKLILRAPTACFKQKINRCNGVSQILAPKYVELHLATNTKAEILTVNFANVLGVSCYELKIKAKHFNGTEVVSTIYTPQDEDEFETLQHKYYVAALYCKNPLLADKNWKLYHNLNLVFAHAKHAYARTIHTAQGSTIDNVFVDDKDIDKCGNIHLRKKLRYVAYTRAKNNLWRLR